jgi:hypothetical protein
MKFYILGVVFFIGSQLYMQYVEELQKNQNHGSQALYGAHNPLFY